MDFLPYPDEPAQAGIEVPFLCTQENLERFVPQEVYTMNLASFINDILLPKVVSSENVLEIAVLAQAGIYLPILQKVVGESFNLKDFITTAVSSPATQIITLKRLHETSGWANKWFRGRDFIFEQLLLDLYWEYPPAANNFFESVTLLEAFDAPCWIIGFSIWALLWSVSPRRVSEFYTFRRRIGIDWPENRLVAADWCPFWAHALTQKLSPFQLYYMSGIPRSRHVGHDACRTAEPCTAYDVQYETYQTKHAAGCGKTGCSFRGVEGENLDHLASIISKGGIPLIRLTPRSGSADADVEVEVVEHTYGRPFIAISHVWSGGLGNFSANTLPQCQLDFLYQSARRCTPKFYGEGAMWYSNDDVGNLHHLIDGIASTPSAAPLYLGLKGLLWLQNASKSVILGATGEDITAIYLWIDTLCIPVNPAAPDQKSLQMKAIDSMTLVYSMAMQVLVIDQSVMELSMRTESGPSLAAELLTCPWMTRSWTYQEGSLSRSTSFLLNDGLVTPRSTSVLDISSELKSATRIFEKALMDEFLIELNNMPDVLNRSVRGTAQDDTAMFVQIWNDLAPRRTSIPDDLHGLLAVLLGLSAKEVLGPRTLSGSADYSRNHQTLAPPQTPVRAPADRMLALYLSQPSLPLSMVLKPFPSDTPMCGCGDWMPRFPTGSLDLSFGTMAWNLKRTHHSYELLFSLQDSDLCALVTECSVRALCQGIIPTENYPLLPENAENLSRVFVVLEPHAPETIDQIPSGSPLCLLMHVKTHHGACFFLSTAQNDINSTLRLNFICPLIWREHLPIQVSEPSVDERTGNLIPARLITDSVCILDCEAPVALKPRYRRPIAKTLQKSLRVPIGATITIVWAYAALSLFRDPCWSHVDPLKSTPLTQWMATTPGLGWYWKFSVMVMRRARIMMPLAFFSGRRSFFDLIDVPRLEAVAERVRYERLARSLDSVSVEDLEVIEQPTRLDIEPSYQFPRRWLLWIPIGCAVYGVAGIPLMDKYLIPKSWKYGWERAMGAFMVKAVVGELIGRIVVERVWRYYRLDLPTGNGNRSTLLDLISY